jgi:hypothetical protein
MPVFPRLRASRWRRWRDAARRGVSFDEASKIERPTIELGEEYEFFCEAQEEYVPPERRLRRYTGKAVTVVRHLTTDEYDGPGPSDPDGDFEVSRMFAVRAADGCEFHAYVEELNGRDRDLGQYFNADGTYGPGRETWPLRNER